jgi:hypothetical protein
MSVMQTNGLTAELRSYLTDNRVARFAGDQFWDQAQTQAVDQSLPTVWVELDGGAVEPNSKLNGYPTGEATLLITRTGGFAASVVGFDVVDEVDNATIDITIRAGTPIACEQIWRALGPLFEGQRSFVAGQLLIESSQTWRPFQRVYNTPNDAGFIYVVSYLLHIRKANY